MFLGKTVNAVQLAERVVLVLKPLDDLEPSQQRQVLEAAIATCERAGAEKKS